MEPVAQESEEPVAQESETEEQLEPWLLLPEGLPESHFLSPSPLTITGAYSVQCERRRLPDAQLGPLAVRLDCLLESSCSVLRLLRFHTSESGDEQISLQQYMERMPSGQTHIWYITGETLEELASLDIVKYFRTLPMEVIFAVHPEDQSQLSQIDECRGVPLHNLRKPPPRRSESRNRTQKRRE